MRSWGFKAKPSASASLLYSMPVTNAVNFLEFRRLSYMVRIWRIVAACAGWLGLGLFLYATVANKSGMAVVVGIVNYFSYFTILSNIMVAGILTLVSLFPGSSTGRFAARADVRTCVAVYITVTGVVYLVLLSNLSPPGGVRHTANVLLHYVVPVMYVVDWFSLCQRERFARSRC